MKLDELSEASEYNNADIFIKPVEPDYELRFNYWSSQKSTFFAMLKGYIKLNASDIKFQKAFFQEYEKHLPAKETCLELFGGTGRIYELLLRHIFK